MQIQVNTDHNIEGSQRLEAYVRQTLHEALERFSEQTTRVEVHLRDESSQEKTHPDDKRCLLEVRLAGRKPEAVTHDASTIEQAIDGAAEKMARALDHDLGRLAER